MTKWRWKGNCMSPTKRMITIRHEYSLVNHWVLRRPTKVDHTFAYIGASCKDVFWVYYYTAELTAELMSHDLYFWITLGKSIKSHISDGNLASASNFLFCMSKRKILGSYLTAKPFLWQFPKIEAGMMNKESTGKPIMPAGITFRL